jgi:glycosyltransferase involved in cell wall biosynthesis
MLENRSRVLLFVDWFLPGYKAGGPIKSIAGLVTAMNGKQDIDIITRDRDFKGETSYEGITRDEWVQWSNGIRVCYLTPGLNLSLIRKLTKGQNYGVIYTNSFFSFHYSIKIRFMFLAGMLKAKKFVVAPRGELKRAALNVKAWKKDLFLSLAKRLGIYKGVTWHSTSGIETTDIHNIFGYAAKTKQLSNFSPLKTSRNQLLRKQSGILRIVFLSRIIEYKNLAFALDVLAGIHLLENEKIIFDIYGPLESESYWQECSQKIKGMLTPQMQIAYKGEVKGEEVVKVFSQYHLFIFPTLGENFGHVIAESLIAGTPVLVSDKTPWRRLQQEHAGWDFPLDRIDAFRTVVADMLKMDNEAFVQQSAAVKRYAANKINNQETIENYLQLFNS